MARGKTSEQVKDWERKRKADEAKRRAARPTSDVGARLRTVKALDDQAWFVAVPPDTGTGVVVRCGPVGEQQRRSLTRVFEADGYTITKGRAG